MAKVYTIPRRERRIPMELGVHLTGHPQAPGVEATFTENVSSRGARVITTRRWQTNDRVVIASLPGDFRAQARVAYCQPQRGDGFAIGLEFLEPSGQWVVQPAVALERTSNR